MSLEVIPKRHYEPILYRREDPDLIALHIFPWIVASVNALAIVKVT